MNNKLHILKKIALYSVSIAALSTANVYSAIDATPGNTPSTSTSSDKPTLYGVSVSPYVRKIMIIFHEKGLEYNLQEVLPVKLLKMTKATIPADFQKASPLGKIPAYQEGDWTIADSRIIADYIEHAYPQTPLYPQDSKLRARALWFEMYADEVLASVTHLKIFMEKIVKPKVLKAKTDEKIVSNAIKNELPPLLDYLEKEIGDKQWIVGDDFTIADISLANQLNELDMCGVKIDATKWPKLAAYEKRLNARESIQKILKSKV